MEKLYKGFFYLLHCLRKSQEIKTEKIIDVICINFKKSICKLHIQILISSLVILVKSSNFGSPKQLDILFDSEPKSSKTLFKFSAKLKQYEF